MKKTLAFLLWVSMLLTFAGCNNDKTKKENKTVDKTTTVVTATTSYEEDTDKYYNTFENFEDTFTKVDKKTKNYIIKSSEEHAGNIYEVYDNDGNLLDEGYHGYRGSFNLTKTGNIVTLEYGYGGTNVFPDYKFYDVERGIASRYFYGLAPLYGSLIAYFDYIEEEEKHIIVVRDVFDVDKAYTEYDANFIDNPSRYLNDMKFSNDGTKIHLEYHDPETNSIKKKVIELD